MTDQLNTQDGFLNVIESVHQRIHFGQNFIGSDIVAALADAADQEYLIITGAIPPHYTTSISVTGEASFFLFEDTTVSANGSSISLFNNNRNSSNTPGLQFFDTPTVTADGTEILGIKLQAGEKEKGVTATEQRNELILLPSSNYLLRITNQAGAAINLGVVIDFYEPN